MRTDKLSKLLLLIILIEKSTLEMLEEDRECACSAESKVVRTFSIMNM